MSYTVVLLRNATDDIREIVRHIAERDAPEKAKAVASEFKRVIDGLAEFPARGPHPSELQDLGYPHVRELFFKPYRIIYEVDGITVNVLMVLDGRRNFRSLLLRRLVR